MSKITITDLEVQFCVGVPDEERAKPQRLLITVDMAYDFSSAATTDRITKTIDYYQVAQQIIGLGQGRSWKLIEKLANDIAELVLSEFQPEAVTVVVKKFPIPQAAHVSVSLTRHRQGRGVTKQAAWGIP
jgi:dihydroneopterin aldolase